MVVKTEQKLYVLFPKDGVTEHTDSYPDDNGVVFTASSEDQIIQFVNRYFNNYNLGEVEIEIYELGRRKGIFPKRTIQFV